MMTYCQYSKAGEEKSSTAAFVQFLSVELASAAVLFARTTVPLERPEEHSGIRPA